LATPYWRYAGAGAAALLALYACFFYELTGAGILSADEPRYAAIAREMARSGDWITPRLWGSPWFEKPAFVYWTGALGFRAGLDDDWAPRLPIALLSAGFLVFLWAELRRQFDARLATYATVILGTSAMWIGYSHVAVMDIPLTVFFTAAVVLALPWLRGREDARRLPRAAACLGLAVFAKGLVPLVLILPLLWEGRACWRDLVRPRVAAAFFLTAAPWYVACAWTNGEPFLRKLFFDHHVGRFLTNDLLHRQPAGFYIPVMLAAVFPWTAAVIASLRSPWREPLPRFLLLWLLWGLVFFSASTNKLPGYVLPLLPAWALLAALRLEAMGDARPVWLATGLLMMLVPPLVDVLPQALAHGLSRAKWPGPDWTWLVPAAAVLPAWRLERAGRRLEAFLLFALLAVGGVVFLKHAALPRIDREVSARTLWRQIAPQRDRVCVEEPLVRHWRYGLNYYSVTPLADCATTPRPLRVVAAPGSPPVLQTP